METLTVQELLEYQEVNEEAIIGGGLLYPKTRMLLYGRSGSLKTMLGVHIAFCIAGGLPVFGYSTTRQSVLYVQMEIPKMLFRDRIAMYCNNGNIPKNLYFSTQPYLKLDRDTGLHEMQKALCEVKPDILIIDPLYKIISGNINEHQPTEHLQGNIDQLKEKFNLAVIIIAHTRQAQMDIHGNEIDCGEAEIMGSSNWPHWFDSIIKISRDNADSRYVGVEFQKHRNTKDEMMPTRMHMLDNLHWKMVGE